MTGKNFSTNNVTGNRKKSDFYETPYSMTRQFLEAREINTHLILEPAAGDGAIARVLSEYGFATRAYDKETNFLLENKHYDWIITNPPFSLSMDFIEKAKQVSDNFAFLLPLSYLHGKRRFDLVYSDKNFPLVEVWVFTRYPMLGDPLRGDGKYRTGMMVYAWFVFSRESNVTSPTIHWLDNNDYVIGAKDALRSNHE